MCHDDVNNMVPLPPYPLLHFQIFDKMSLTAKEVDYNFEKPFNLYMIALDFLLFC